MSRYANTNPEHWDYLNVRSYRSNTLAPTESATQYARRVVADPVIPEGQVCEWCGEGLATTWAWTEAICERCEDRMQESWYLP